MPRGETGGRGRTRWPRLAEVAATGSTRQWWLLLGTIQETGRPRARLLHGTAVPVLHGGTRG